MVGGDAGEARIGGDDRDGDPQCDRQGPLPRIATTSKARRNSGKASRIVTMRETLRSTQRGASPATVPRTPPMIMAMRTARNPTRTESRAPCTTRA